MLHTSPAMQGADVNLESGLQMSWAMLSIYRDGWIKSSASLCCGWGGTTTCCHAQNGHKQGNQRAWSCVDSLESSPRGVNTETIGKLKQEESGFEAHILTDSIFIGFHGIAYCTQSALRYSQDKGFPKMFRCRTMILARSSEIHRPRKLGNLHVWSWCRGETPRWGWIGLWIL